MQWRVVVQREVDKLYRSLLEMAQSKLVSRDGETPEEAIFGVRAVVLLVAVTLRFALSPALPKNCLSTRLT